MNDHGPRSSPPRSQAPRSQPQRRRRITRRSTNATTRRLRRRWPGWLWTAGLLLACALVGAGVMGYGLWSWSRTPLAGAGYTYVHLDNSADLDATGERLVQQQVVDSAFRFKFFVRWFNPTLSLEPGGHWLPLDTSPEQVVLLLARRQSRKVADVTLAEGWDSFQMGERLAAAGVCSAEAFVRAVHDASAAREAVGQASFEGYLYPETYELRQNTHPEQVVAKLVAQARVRLASLFTTDPISVQGVTLNRQEWVTLASIVQKEAADEQEMPNVASVFLNRLRDPLFRPQRMLQSDPTAGYGCKLPDAPASCAGFNGRITPQMLRDPLNRYNTYKQPGLPPSPIGNPSHSALLAVWQAPSTRFYFFVLGSGGKHRFSETLAAHQQAIGR